MSIEKIACAIALLVVPAARDIDAIALVRLAGLAERRSTL
jgi:hypothetical protein